MQALKNLKHHSHSYAKSLKGVRPCHTSLPFTEKPSNIRNFYKNRNVFVTGATGFMGKVLVEKMLRSCPEIGNVYVLIRAKKRQDSQSRMEQLLNSKIFARLKVEQPAAIKKLIPVSGDSGQPWLGMNEADERTLIENVSIVFHNAANVKFYEDLRTAILQNAGSTLSIVELCRKMENLEALIDLSTAYVRIHGECEEKIYPISSDPAGLVKAFRESWMTDEMMQALTPVLVNSGHCTYTYSKALAENVLFQESKGIPTAIVRPSLVAGSWRDPYPGWIDTVIALNGMTLGAMNGVFRIVRMSKGRNIEIIPVDVCINLMLAAAWHLVKTKPKEIQVYNCTSEDINPLPFREYLKECNINSRKNPLNHVFWYPKISAKSSKYLYYINVFCFHKVLGFSIDCFSRLLGQKPIALKTQKNIQTILTSAYNNERDKVKFKTGNQWKVWKDMCDNDKEEFNFDLRKLHWPTYIENLLLGFKEYYLKEDMTAMPKARQNLKRKLYIRNFIYLLGISCSGTLIGITLNFV